MTKDGEIGKSSFSSIYDIKLIISNKSVPEILEMVFELLELEYKNPHNDRDQYWIQSEKMKNTE